MPTVTNVALAGETNYPSRDFAQTSDWDGLYFGKSGPTDFAMNLMLDPSFSDSERSIIKQSMKSFVERSMDDAVINCTYSNATKNFPESREKLKSQILEALSYRKLNDLSYPGYAYVERFWSNQRVVGLGDINLFYEKTNPLPGYSDRHYLHVALNSDHLGEGSSYLFATNTEYWAGVLGHEFLHNLGFDHPTGTSGSFVMEYGNCIWKNGLGKVFPEGALEDPSAFKDL